MSGPPRALQAEDLLTEAEVAALLRLKPDTLRQWRTGKRHAGKGPTFIQRGKARVLYLRADLEAWLLLHRRDTQPKGTSDA